MAQTTYRYSNKENWDEGDPNANVVVWHPSGNQVWLFGHTRGVKAWGEQLGTPVAYNIPYVNQGDLSTASKWQHIRYAIIQEARRMGWNINENAIYNALTDDIESAGNFNTVKNHANYDGSLQDFTVSEVLSAGKINAIIYQLNYRGSEVCTCNCNFCTCNCNYCTCNCNYCTCNCNYAGVGVTCSCNAQDSRIA